MNEKSVVPHSSVPHLDGSPSPIVCLVLVPDLRGKIEPRPFQVWKRAPPRAPETLIAIKLSEIEAAMFCKSSQPKVRSNSNLSSKRSTSARVALKLVKPFLSPFLQSHCSGKNSPSLHYNFLWLRNTQQHRQVTTIRSSAMVNESFTHVDSALTSIRTENCLTWSSRVLPSQIGCNEEHTLQMQQGAQIPLCYTIQHDGANEERQPSRRMVRSLRSSRRCKLAAITLEEYMNVFNHLTDRKGNVVQPDSDIKSITAAQLNSVSRLHAIQYPASTRKTKEIVLESLVGIELWNPYILPAGLVETGHITDDEMLDALRVLEWQMV